MAAHFQSTFYFLSVFFFCICLVVLNISSHLLYVKVAVSLMLKLPFFWGGGGGCFMRSLFPPETHLVYFAPHYTPPLSLSAAETVISLSNICFFCLWIFPPCACSHIPWILTTPQTQCSYFNTCHLQYISIPFSPPLKAFRWSWKVLRHGPV